MMRLYRFILVGWVLVVGLMIVPLHAEETNVDAATKAEPAAELLDLDLAFDLAAYGEREGDPLALILAVRIIKQTPTQLAEDLQKEEGEPIDAAELESDRDARIDQLLAQARELARDQDDILELITDVEQLATRRVVGVAGGSYMTMDQVLGNHTDIWRITFQGGVSAGVILEGNGNTDLDLYVFDGNGNLICSSLSYTDRESCYWTPLWTGVFQIEVVNLGPISNRYIIHFM